jgi:acyl carrier protein
MTRLTRAMEEEIKEILCELLDVEPFELTSPNLLARRCANDDQRAVSVRSTLECAFGVTIEESERTRMVDLPTVYDVVGTAVAGKRRRPA